jgi:deoxyribonuclease V
MEHSWDVTPKEAVEIQRRLAELVSEKPDFRDVKTVAGVDVCIRGNQGAAAIVALELETLEVVETAVFRGTVVFPYVPGLLTFREGPLVLKAAEKLGLKPDLFIFDGQGRAHPRRLGLASHMGLWLDAPSVGCAKTRLCGKYEAPGIEKGSVSPLVEKGETIGAAVRTRTGVKPVFVSAGHRIDLESSVRYVLSCCVKYRLPETTRKAHRLASF